jgi:hypothetical protein
MGSDHKPHSTEFPPQVWRFADTKGEFQWLVCYKHGSHDIAESDDKL